MGVEIRGTVIYPIMADRTIMSIRQIGKIHSKHRVRAATYLSCNSATEVIDVNRLSQKTSSIIKCADVTEANGQLYCIDNPVNSSYWVKIITLAKDCQSNNVILMSTERGVVLKTVRVITPGEPLQMWFNESILAMMNMPFLTPPNIQGQNRYICHVCSSSFEHPNPLKIHLALKCNQLDSNHLWASLASEFIAMTNPTISMNRFTPAIPAFTFELTMPPNFNEKRSTSNQNTTAIKIPPNPKTTITNCIPTSSISSSSHLSTSASSNENLSTSSEQASPHNSSTDISPVRTAQACRTVIPTSAFKPYVTKPTLQRNYTSPHNNLHHHTEPVMALPPTVFHGTAPVPALMPHAAQMETIVSNLGRSKEGHFCIYCGKVYSRKYGLKIHIRTHTGYKPLKCKYCLRPFGDPSNLNKHVRLHADGETPYKCDLCGKVLVRRRDLERHMRSRHVDNLDYNNGAPKEEK